MIESSVPRKSVLELVEVVPIECGVGFFVSGLASSTNREKHTGSLFGRFSISKKSVKFIGCHVRAACSHFPSPLTRRP